MISFVNFNQSQDILLISRKIEDKSLVLTLVTKIYTLSMVTIGMLVSTYFGIDAMTWSQNRLCPITFLCKILFMQYKNVFIINS